MRYWVDSFDSANENTTVPQSEDQLSDGFHDVLARSTGLGSSVDSMGSERAAAAAVRTRRAGKAAKATNCRMFETPLIEFFSHIHPASPFAFWIPALGAMTAYELFAGMALLELVGLFVVGWLAWSLTEYLLHRYVFHWIGKKPWQRRFHFIFHGVHHDFPQDPKRLVFPLGVSIPLGLVFFLAMDGLFERLTAIALFSGFGAGYLAYDGIHYFTHHMPARSRLGKFLKRYHMVHHHTGVEGMWGVSHPLWDYLFGSAADLRTKGDGVRAG